MNKPVENSSYIWYFRYIFYVVWVVIMKTKTSILSIIVLLWITSPAATAAQLRFITLDVAPWASVDANTGDVVGVFADVIKEIEQRTGHKVEMTLTPFARIDRELESGQQDCTILVPGDSRKKFTQQGELLSYHTIGVIARPGVNLETYEDLKPLTISVLRGAPMSPQFDADTSLLKEFDTDYLIGIRKIAHKRLDAIAGAVSTIRFLAKQQGMAEHLGQQLALTEVPLLLQCSKKSPNIAIMPELNDAIRALKQDGTLRTIEEHYHF